jgi:hypothetical protein
LNVRFSQDAVRRAVGFTVGSIRVENTLYGCQCPLLLASPVSRSVFGVVVHSPAGLAGGAAAAAAAAEYDEDALGETGDSAVQQHTAAVSAVASEAATATSALANSSAAADNASQAAAAATAAFAAAAQLLQQQSAHEQQQQQQQQPPMLLPHQLAFGVLATVWRTQPSGVLCVEQLGVQVSPCALSLEGKHLKQLVDFAQSIQAAAAADAAAISYVLPGNGSRGSARLKPPAAAATAAAAAAAAGELAPVLPPSLPAASAGKRGIKLYFEQWQMSAITLCVSFAPDSWFDPLPGGATAAAAAAGAVKGLDASSSSSSSVGKALASAVASVETVAESAAAAEAGAGSSSTSGQEQDASAASNSSKQDRELDPIPGSSSSSSSSTAAVLAEQHSSSSSSSSSSGAAPLPVWLQMALALAHAEEGAWLTLGSFERSHTMINTDSLVQVRPAGYGETLHFKIILVLCLRLNKNGTCQAHAEEGAWLTLGAFERSHATINTDSLV